jgi:hypothetical protein
MKTMKPLLFSALFSLLLVSVGVQAVTCQNAIPPSNPDSIYTDHGNSTVTDTRTGLMWKHCVEGLTGAGCGTGSPVSFIWVDALTHAEGHSFAGYTDWRLPNIKELRSLVEECRVDPAINSALFPVNGASSRVWSGSPNTRGNAWYVDFEDGHVDGSNYSNDFHVRLVRSVSSPTPISVNGQCGVAVNVTSSNSPETGLCVSGIPTSVMTEDTRFSWMCSGLNGGKTASCSALRDIPAPIPVDGQCGVATMLTPSTPPEIGLCTSGGNPSPVITEDTRFSWMCSGLNGGKTASCSALRDIPVPIPVDGQCGVATMLTPSTPPEIGLCTSGGNPSPVITEDTRFSWMCSGLNGGKTASCSALRDIPVKAADFRISDIHAADCFFNRLETEVMVSPLSSAWNLPFQYPVYYRGPYGDLGYIGLDFSTTEKRFLHYANGVISDLGPVKNWLDNYKCNSDEKIVLDQMLENSGLHSDWAGPASHLVGKTYPVSSGYNLEKLYKDHIARIALGIWQSHKMRMEEQISAMTAITENIDNENTQWINYIESVKNHVDYGVALENLLGKNASNQKSFEKVATLVAVTVSAMNSTLKVGLEDDSGLIPIEDGYTEMLKALPSLLALAAGQKPEPKDVLLAALEGLKAKTSFAQADTLKTAVEVLQGGISCLGIEKGSFGLDQKVQCISGQAELIAKSGTRYLNAFRLHKNVKDINMKRYVIEYLDAYYRSAGDKEFFDLHFKKGLDAKLKEIIDAEWYNPVGLFGWDAYKKAMSEINNLGGMIDKQSTLFFELLGIDSYEYSPKMKINYTLPVLSSQDNLFKVDVQNLSQAGFLNLGTHPGSNSLRWKISGNAVITVKEDGRSAFIRFPSPGNYTLSVYEHFLGNDGKIHLLIKLENFIVQNSPY